VGSLVNSLGPGSLDHVGVRKRIMPHNILRPLIEVIDVTTSKISESVASSCLVDQSVSCTRFGARHIE